MIPKTQIKACAFNSKPINNNSMEVYIYILGKYGCFFTYFKFGGEILNMLR